MSWQLLAHDDDENYHATQKSELRPCDTSIKVVIALQACVGLFVIFSVIFIKTVSRKLI